jgi:hypothetical protein
MSEIQICGAVLPAKTLQSDIRVVLEKKTWMPGIKPGKTVSS